MGRTLTFTAGADEFIQGFSPDNIEVTLLMKGGADAVNLNRDDDFGGGNTVDAGTGNDTVVSQAENGNQITWATAMINILALDSPVFQPKARMRFREAEATI